jgi:hypothetical protein
MRFTVIWDPSVVNDVAVLWMNSREPGEIQRAADFFDRTLHHEADRRGIPYGRGERLLTHGPFAASFLVSMDDRIARIAQVWLIAAN